MKVYLDDIRVAPDGWVRTWWPEEVIALLKTGDVTDISLDHDLGDHFGRPDNVKRERTGYDVLLWLERAVIVDGFKPPAIHIHTANPVAEERMKIARDNIYRNANR
ncbi:MAG: hypothetical protein QQN46_03530 [Nitrosopumilus sp.]